MIKIIHIPIELICSGKQQARNDFNQEKLVQLAESIRQDGILQPVLVQTKDAKYILLAGERRWRAAQIAGLTHMPAILRDDIDTLQAHVFGLTENLQRENLNPIEMAQGLADFAQCTNITHAEMAGRLGKSRALITNTLRLLQLPDSIQAQLIRQEITIGHAKILLGLPRAAQIPWANRCAEMGWSVREFAQKTRQVSAEFCAKSAQKKQNWDQIALQNALGEHLGLGIKIHFSAKISKQKPKNFLQIEFDTLEQFEDLLLKLSFRIE